MCGEVSVWLLFREVSPFKWRSVDREDRMAPASERGEAAHGRGERKWAKPYHKGSLALSGVGFALTLLGSLWGTGGIRQVALTWWEPIR